MVKKHSNLIGKTVVGEEQEDDACDDVELDNRFWYDVFDLYFVRGKESRGRQDDDLLFFVRKLVCLCGIKKLNSLVTVLYFNLSVC